MTDTRRKIVPVEATNDMTDAGAANLFETSFHDGPTVQVESTYTAMVAASPDARKNEELLDDIAHEINKARLDDWVSDFDLARAILKTIEGTPND